MKAALRVPTRSITLVANGGLLLVDPFSEPPVVDCAAQRLRRRLEVRERRDVPLQQPRPDHRRYVLQVSRVGDGEEGLPRPLSVGGEYVQQGVQDAGVLAHAAGEEARA